MDLFDNIENNYAKMSKGQKKIAGYIMKYYDKAVFMTASKLGNVVGVSESTVVRFAALLGYDGYPGLQVAMEELVSSKLKCIKRIEVTKSNLSKQEVLEAVLNSDSEKIRLTLESIDQESFETALDIIDSSKKIYICGLRSCMPLASFFGFYLSIIYDNVVVLNTNSLSETFEQMHRINSNDCFIGISFPRYSMRTLKAMELANDKNAKIISITDNNHSPMCMYSSCNLFASSELASVIDSLVAPLSVINAIIVSLFMKNQDIAMKNLEEIENIWDDYQSYDKDEINMLSDRMIHID